MRGAIVLVFLLFTLGINQLYSATFHSNGTGGAWNLSGSWTIASGTDADGIPDSDDDVFIYDDFGGTTSIFLSTAEACNSLTIEEANFSGNATRLIITTGNLTVGGNVTILDQSGSICSIILGNAAAVLTVNGNISFEGLDASKSIISFSQAATLNLAGTINTPGAGGITVTTNGQNGTLVVSSNSSISLPINGTFFAYPNISKTGTGTLSFSADPSSNIKGNISVSAGTLELNTTSFTGNSKNFTVASGATLSLIGTSTFPAGFTFNFQSGSTVSLAGTSHTLGVVGTPSSFTFDNLTIACSGTATLSDSVTVNNILSLESGTLALASFDLTLQSDASGSASVYNALGGTISYTGSGRVVTNRYLGDGVGWTLLASPITDATFSEWDDDLDIFGLTNATPGGGNADIYTWDEPTEAYVAVSGAVGQAIDESKGYFTYLYYDNQTLDMRGSLNLTGQSYSVPNTSGTINGYDGWVMIPNPFQCPVTVNQIIFNGGALSGASVLRAGGTTSGTSYATKSGAQEIAPGEAFWVNNSSAGTSVTLEIPVSAQSNSGGDEFNSDRPLVNEFEIIIEKIGVSDDRIIVRKEDNATSGLDQNYDVLKLNNTGIYHNICIADSNENLAIASYNDFTNLNLPIKLFHTTPQGNHTQYKLYFKNFTKFIADGYCASITDLLTNTTTPISSDNDTIAFTAAVTDNSVRFILNLQKFTNALAIDEYCWNDSTGKIAINVLNAASSNFDWYKNNQLIHQSNNLTQDSLLNLSAGEYKVIISNPGINCGAVQHEVHLKEPQQVIADFMQSANSIDLLNTSEVIFANTATNATSIE